jgi:hypothetical protein
MLPMGKRALVVPTSIRGLLELQPWNDSLISDHDRSRGNPQTSDESIDEIDRRSGPDEEVKGGTRPH